MCSSSANVFRFDCKNLIPFYFVRDEMFCHKELPNHSKIHVNQLLKSVFHDLWHVVVVFSDLKSDDTFARIYIIHVQYM